MKILETGINRTENYRLYDDIVTEADDYLSVGDIFRRCREEYGRCTGKVYVDSKKQGTIAVGWVFVKRQKYDDCDETFLKETWISLLDKDELIRKREWHKIGEAP